MWRQNVASLALLASRIKKPGSVVGAVPRLTPTPLASPGVARCGVRTWRHLPMWRQRASWHRQMCRQNVASFAHEPSGSHVASPNVASAQSTYVASRRGIRRPRPPSTCLQNVSSVVGRYVHPHRRPPAETNDDRARGAKPRAAPNSDSECVDSAFIGRPHLLTSTANAAHPVACTRKRKKSSRARSSARILKCGTMRWMVNICREWLCHAREPMNNRSDDWRK